MRLNRKQGYIDYSSGNLKTFSIANDNLLNKISLRLKADITISGGTTSGSVVSFSPVTFLQRIELVLNGKDTIVSISGKDLFVLNQIETSRANELITLASGDAQSNSMIYSTINIDFRLLNTLVPNLTVLNARLFDDITLKLTWGTTADLISGGDRSITVNDMKLWVTTEEETTQFTTPNNVLKKIATIEQVITASGNQTIDLPRGAIYHNLLLNVQDNSIDNDSLINSIEIKTNGTNVIITNDYNILKMDMVEFYRLAYSEIYTGFVMIPFDKTKELKDAISSDSLTTFKLIGDSNTPTGISKLKLITGELIPIKI